MLFNINKPKNINDKNLNVNDSANAFWGAIIFPMIASVILSLVITFLPIYNADGSIDSERYNSIISSSTFLLVSQFLIQASLFFVIFLMLFKNGKKVKQSVHINANADLSLIILFSIIMIGITYCSNDIVTIFTNVVFEDWLGLKAANTSLALGNFWYYLGSIVVLCIMPAIAEEIIFRGLILGGLLKDANTKGKRFLAVFLSALIFALMHQNIAQFVYPLIIGIFYGIIYLYTGNLFYTMIMHFSSNLFVICVNYVKMIVNAQIKPLEITPTTLTIAIVSGVVALGLMAAVITIARTKIKQSAFYGGSNQVQYNEEDDATTERKINAEEYGYNIEQNNNKIVSISYNTHEENKQKIINELSDETNKYITKKGYVKLIVGILVCIAIIVFTAIG